MISSDSILERATALKSKGVPFVLATVVRCESPTSARPGAKAIVSEQGDIEGWVGGGCAQPAVIATAKKALADGESRLIRVSPTKGGEVEPGIVDFGMTCHSGGTLDIFLEPFGARPALLVIGSAPSAQALTALAARTGFDVSVAAPGAGSESFPEAVQVIDGLDLAALQRRPAMIVVATQGKRDEPGLEAALATGSSYIAFVASARKADKLRTYLKERGHDAQAVDAIVSPAGVEIGAVTPEEIALSILAELVKVRRQGQPADTTIAPEPIETGPASQRQEPSFPALNVQIAPMPHSTDKSSKEGSAIDPICGMTVEIAGAEFTSEYDGKTFYFCCAGCQHSFEKAPEEYLGATGVGA